MGEYNRPLSIPSHIDRYSMPTDDLNGTLCARLRWLYSFLYCRTAPLPGWLSLSLLYYSTALINFPSSLSLLCILYIYPLSRCWVSFLMRAHMFTQWPCTRSIDHLFFFFLIPSPVGLDLSIALPCIDCCWCCWPPPIDTYLTALHAHLKTFSMYKTMDIYKL